MAFIEAHATEVAAAVLTAPSFLIGLTASELNIIKQRIEARANPELAQAKAATLKALEQCESGRRNAANQIRARGGLELPHDGVAQRSRQKCADGCENVRRKKPTSDALRNASQGTSCLA